MAQANFNLQGAILSESLQGATLRERASTQENGRNMMRRIVVTFAGASETLMYTHAETQASPSTTEGSTNSRTLERSTKTVRRLASPAGNPPQCRDVTQKLKLATHINTTQREKESHTAVVVENEVDLPEAVVAARRIVAIKVPLRRTRSVVGTGARLLVDQCECHFDVLWAYDDYQQNDKFGLKKKKLNGIDMGSTTEVVIYGTATSRNNVNEFCSSF